MIYLGKYTDKKVNNTPKAKKIKNEVGNVDVDIIVEDIDGIETGFLPINEVAISKEENGNSLEAYIGYLAENDKEEENEKSKR